MSIKLKNNGKTKLKVYQNFSNYYDEMNYLRQSGDFPFEVDPFSKNAEREASNIQEVLLIMIFFQPTSENKKINII